MGKGAVNLLMVVIIIVIVFLLLIVFTSRSSSYFDNFADEKICSLSFVDSGSHVEISNKCPTNLIKVTQDSILRNGQEVNLIDKGTVSSKDVEKVIAEELVTCWGRFGNGKIELDPPSKENCFICSDIRIQNLGEQSFDLRQFLRQNDIVEDQTYQEYLTQDINTDDFHYNLSHLNPIELRSNESYFIINGRFFDEKTQTSELIYSRDLLNRCKVLE